MNEQVRPQSNGWIILAINIITFIFFGLLFYLAITSFKHHQTNGIYFMVPAILMLIISIFITKGYFTVEPNNAAVLLLFGKYVGTEKTNGFRWANPLYSVEKVSLRARNFDSQRLKVNDKNGNPIEISCVIVWKVQDTAEALFKVEEFTDYVHMQSESALRHLTMAFAYDNTEGDEITLRSSTEEVSTYLKSEIESRVKGAGVHIIEARINHLAYSPEIAQAMLQRQQAEAIIAARQKIVDGAVGMVDMALKKLGENNIVELDEERKAAMVSNLMIVLCSDKNAQPIVNAGSLY